MTARRHNPQTLDEVLQSTSDTLFPAELGRRKVELSSRDVDGDTPLHVIVWRNDLAGAELLVAAGADIDAIGDMGETPLHIAVRNKNPSLVLLLLRADAKIGIRSEFGTTPREMSEQIGGEIGDMFTKSSTE